MANLRAGLVGLGMMGRHHARVLASLDGVDLVAVVDPGGDVHGVAQGRDVLNSVGELGSVRTCTQTVPLPSGARVGSTVDD